MKNTAIIIPTRLAARRFPNKPLAKINNIPMIIHVLNRAKESQVGEVYVATPDKEIFDIVNDNGGVAILSEGDHNSGSDRVHEIYLKKLENNVDLIINLQGDMPNIKPSCITRLEKLMRSSGCDIGTLASDIKNTEELLNPNIVKAYIKNLSENNIVDDFDRSFDLSKKDFLYHHIGIYGYKRNALEAFIGLNQSKAEIDRKLEQMRAIENDMKIALGLIDELPISVDTQEDLEAARRIMVL